MKNSEIFKQTGYCSVNSIISTELRDFVTQYALFDEMRNFSATDSQVSGAHSKYADPAMETVLMILHPLMEENTGLKLYPTYSYYRVYRKGDILHPHLDRPSCEISTTVCFNYNYQDSKTNWPIYMDGNKVLQNPGDAVIYRGCDLSHWREELQCEDDDWHVQGFFHYVDVNGPYSNYKYDRRQSIGLKDSNIGIKNYNGYVSYSEKKVDKIYIDQDLTKMNRFFYDEK
jgi:hypothetical protein